MRGEDAAKREAQLKFEAQVRLKRKLEETRSLYESESCDGRTTVGDLPSEPPSSSDDEFGATVSGRTNASTAASRAQVGG